MVGVLEVKLTGRPELAVAVSVTGIEVLITWAGIAAKVMVCAMGLTVKLCVTMGAAAYTVLPACVAWMVQVPAASSEAVDPETVQMVSVVELRLTGRPELAVAVNATVVLAVWAGINTKVMVCWVLPVPMPLNRMLCVAYPGAAVLSALSVNTAAPLKAPAVAGVKLMGNKQDWPDASVPAVEEPALNSGQMDAPLLFSVKFAAILGLLPALGIGKFSAALPTFSTVTVCGLSLLVKPGAVGAKLKLGVSAKSSFNTRLLP
jgi:hypothetical protein